MSARRPHLVAVLAAVLPLGACGGAPADPGPPTDAKLEQASNAGNQAMSMDLHAVAVREFKVALARAYERDDARAIADGAYNLGLAQMKAGTPAEAIATVRRAEGELERRRSPVPAELSLVIAAASYRAGDRAGAASAARQALSRSAADPDTSSRAWFIRGLVAADQRDGAALAQAISALRPSKIADLEADRLELLGRAALLDGRAAEAVKDFDQSTGYRQQALDYRGMARTLAVAGEASLQQQQTAEAAVYFLRAGRSAQLQGDQALGSALLKRAEDLARQTGQNGIVEEVRRLRAESRPPPARI